MNVVTGHAPFLRFVLVLVVAVAASLTAPRVVTAEGKERLSKLEVLALLHERRFDKLETWILQGGKAGEEGCCDWRISTFAHSDPANQALLDAWVLARPRSFVALMARGTYSNHLGWLRRGDGTVSTTSRRQMVRMRPYFLSAKKDFEAALALNPRMLSAYENLLNIGMVLGRHDFVDEVYRSAREYFPESPGLARTYLFTMQLKWRGDRRTFFSFWRQLKDRHGADERYAFLDHFVSGNELHPAELMKWEGKSEELLAYSEARLAKWNDVRAMQWRAVALERLGRGIEAEAELRRAIALAPFMGALYKDLARVHYGRNEMEEAKAAVDTYVAFDPYNPDRLIYRAQLYTDGIALHYQYARRDEPGLEALFEQALSDLDRAAHYGRDRPDVAATRALVLHRKGGDPAAVISGRRRAVQLTPLDPRRWRELATALYDDGNCKALSAFKQYRAVCRRTKSCTIDHYFENVIHEGGRTDQCFGLKREEPQQTTREDGVRLSPFELEYPVCASTLRTTPPDEAIEICRRKAESGNLDAQYELYSLHSLGLLVERDFEKAMAWLSMAAEAGDGRALTRFAYIHLYGLHGHKIDFERARRYFERGMAIGHPEAFVGLSRALFHGQNVAPNREKARALLDRAIALGSQEARRNLQRYFPGEDG